MKQTSLLFLSALAIASDAFTPCNTCISKPKSNSHPSCLFSTPNEEESSELIIGSEMSTALQGIGSQAGYLDYAKKRNEEAKAKMVEQVRLEEEETERKRREKEAKGNEGNFGPGDLSSFVGFENDGFEASEGNDKAGGWGEAEEEKEEEAEEDAPALFLFGDDDDSDSGGSGLIL